MQMEKAALPSSEPKQALLIAVSWSCRCLSPRRPTIKLSDERWLTPPELLSTIRKVNALAPSHPWAAMEFPAFFPLLKWGWHVWADAQVRAGDMCGLGARLPRTPSSHQPGSAQHRPSLWTALHTSPAQGWANVWSQHGYKLCCIQPCSKWWHQPRDWCGNTAGDPGTESSPMVPSSFMSPCPLHPAPQPLPGHRAAGSRKHMDLGKNMSTWSPQGEGRPCTWSLVDRCFPQVAIGQGYSIAKADKKSKYVTHSFCRDPMSPWGKHAKGWQNCVGLAGVKSSWFLSFPVLHRWNAVLPPYRWVQESELHMYWSKIQLFCLLIFLSSGFKHQSHLP